MFENIDWGTFISQACIALISTGIFGKFLNHKYEKQLSELKAKLESSTFISNKQYEREFEIYQAIWKKMPAIENNLNAIQSFFTFDLSISFVDLASFSKEKSLIQYKDAIEAFKNLIIESQPFIETEIYRKLIDVNTLCELYMTNIYGIMQNDTQETNCYEESGDMIFKSYQDLIRAINISSKAVYVYLNSLRVK